MPAPAFRPRETSTRPCEKLTGGELFDQILERVHRDLPDAVGLAITVHARSAGMTVLATRGTGPQYLHAQVSGLGGPVPTAVEHQMPVLSLDLWSDDRWPQLTADAVRAFDRDAADLQWARGAAAVPGVWREEQTVVLSCLLSKPAETSTVTTLIGYEQLVASALVAWGAAGKGAEMADMLEVLQSRGAIEQAKGAIMGALRCDADTAWSVLRRASHESNVRLRVLAVALVERIGGVPAEQPAAGAPIVPDEHARRAAQLLWAVLSRAPRSPAD